MSKSENEIRFEEALYSGDPAGNLGKLAEELRDAGMTQVDLYLLFEKYFVKMQESVEDYPRCDAVADIMDCICGGPWAKGCDLYPDQIDGDALQAARKERGDQMKFKKGLILAVFGLAMTMGVAAEELPDPLVAIDSTKITSAEQWLEKRRPELLDFFTREMYGVSPGKPEKMVTDVFDRDAAALDGKATRIQIAMYPGGKPGPRIDLLVYVPNGAKGPVPAFLGLNFWGNHGIHKDPGIRLTESWVENNRQPYVDLSGVQDHRATDATRGINAKQWPVEEILSRGYAVATLYREDVAPDREPYFSTGVPTLYPELQKGDDNFGTVAAWAWSLSRALDVLEKEPSIDSKRVAAFGFSRLGKAALWAGASDERFAMVISNESGAGGAKLFRRGVGEDIKRLNTLFPHWFAKSFRKYIDRDKELTFDQHMVISLIAPRPVYVASAEDDKNADPEGEYAGAKAAEPVFRLLGAEGLPADKWPPVGTSVQGGIGYHVRAGKHDVTDFDWEQYLAFADRHWKRP